MAIRSPSEQIPLPFATAAIGLCLSYFFGAQIAPLSATLVGFAIGVFVLYLTGRLDRMPYAAARGSERATCPACGSPLVIVLDESPRTRDAIIESIRRAQLLKAEREFGERFEK
jgi:hypothetical protein